MMSWQDILTCEERNILWQLERHGHKTENPEPVNGSEKSKKRSKWAVMAAERELWENEGFELPKPKISESKKMNRKINDRRKITTFVSAMGIH